MDDLINDVTLAILNNNLELRKLTAGARNYNIYWKYQASVLGVTGNPSALHPPTSSTATAGTDAAEGAEGSDEAAATSCKFNGAFLGKGFGVIIHYLNVDPNQYIDQYSNIIAIYIFQLPGIQL